MPEYEVRVCRTTYMYQTIRVHEDSEDEAEEKAEDLLEDDSAWDGMEASADVEIAAVSCEKVKGSEDADV